MLKNTGTAKGTSEMTKHEPIMGSMGRCITCGMNYVIVRKNGHKVVIHRAELRS